MGEVDLDYAASLLGVSREEARAAMGESIYQVPSPDETFQTRAEYLSGNVREKLEIAQAAALTVERFAPNVQALTEAIPEPLRMDEVEPASALSGSTQAPHQEFVREILSDPYATVFNAAGSTWGRQSQPPHPRGHEQLGHPADARLGHPQAGSRTEARTGH